MGEEEKASSAWELEGPVPGRVDERVGMRGIDLYRSRVRGGRTEV